LKSAFKISVEKQPLGLFICEFNFAISYCAWASESGRKNQPRFTFYWRVQFCIKQVRYCNSYEKVLFSGAGQLNAKLAFEIRSQSEQKERLFYTSDFRGRFFNFVLLKQLFSSFLIFFKFQA
jgi:hypothetical protein